MSVVGPKTLAKAMDTEHGRYANLLGRILHDWGTKSERIDGPRYVYVSQDCLPACIERYDSKGKPQEDGAYVNVHKALRQLESYLEGQAIREVCP